MLRLLDGVTFHQALLFCNDRPQAAALAKRLCDGGYPAAFLSADLPQAERSALVRRMHSFQLRVLVATDLLARGVDFGRVSLVVQMQAAATSPPTSTASAAPAASAPSASRCCWSPTTRRRPRSRCSAAAASSRARCRGRSTSATTCSGSSG